MIAGHWGCWPHLPYQTVSVFEIDLYILPCPTRRQFQVYYYLVGNPVLANTGFKYASANNKR